LETEARYRLRDAVLSDAGDLFRWRNNRETRVWSRDISDVCWDEHVTWLKSTLRNPNQRLLIGEDERDAVGTIRRKVWLPSARGERWNACLLVMLHTFIVLGVGRPGTPPDRGI
jgi:hypothetical protein